MQIIQNSTKTSFRPEAIGMVIALLGEFILGIYSTFFLHFPENASQKELWQFSSTDLVLNLHMILGLIITLGTIMFVARVLISRSKTWLSSAVLATIGTIIATLAGVIFIPTQSDAYAFTMGIGFSLAVAGYVWGLFKNQLA